MDRRGFMRIVAGIGVIPVIGLPKPTGAAPINLIQGAYDAYIGRRVIIGHQEALQRWPKLHGRSYTWVILDEWGTVPAGTMMVYANDDCRTVKPASRG